MAKTSMVNRETKRAKLAKKFAARREALKKTVSSHTASFEEKMEAAVKLQKLVLGRFVALRLRGALNLWNLGSRRNGGFLRGTRHGSLSQTLEARTPIGGQRPSGNWSTSIGRLVEDSWENACRSCRRERHGERESDTPRGQFSGTMTSSGPGSWSSALRRAAPRYGALLKLGTRTETVTGRSALRPSSRALR